MQSGVARRAASTGRPDAKDGVVLGADLATGARRRAWATSSGCSRRAHRRRGPGIAMPKQRSLAGRRHRQVRLLPDRCAPGVRLAGDREADARRSRAGPDSAAARPTWTTRRRSATAAAGAARASTTRSRTGPSSTAALLRALAREGRDLADHRPHRDGGRAQHRRVARAARDGEEPRHRHPAHDGRAGAGDSPHLHLAGTRRSACVGTIGRRRARPASSARRRSIPAHPAAGRTSIRSPTCRSACGRSTSSIVVVAAVAVCLLATIYPSRQAGRLDPAEALRNQ